MLLKVLLENPSVFKNALKPSKIEATSRTALTLSYFILEMERSAEVKLRLGSNAVQYQFYTTRWCSE